MKYDENAVRAKIAASLTEDEYGPYELVADIAFHMTDWLADLERWDRFCSVPVSYDSSEVSNLVRDFLVHVPNHVAAASKLFLDIPVSDVFEVGATERSDD